MSALPRITVFAKTTIRPRASSDESHVMVPRKLRDTQENEIKRRANRGEGKCGEKNKKKGGVEDTAALLRINKLLFNGIKKSHSARSSILELEIKKGGKFEMSARRWCEGGRKYPKKRTGTKGSAATNARRPRTMNERGGMRIE